MKTFRLIFLIILTLFSVLNAEAKRNTNTYKKKTVKKVAPLREYPEVKPLFLGCNGEEKTAKEIEEILGKIEIAWNNHQINELLKYYAVDFKSKDGADIKNVKENLNDFWKNYPDAQLQSIISSIYVCGDYATINLTEIAKASEYNNNKIKDNIFHFKAIVSGFTYLKKNGDSWQIIDEDIISETIYKYLGKSAKDYIEKGYLKLIGPDKVEANENYIVKLEYNLPAGIEGLAFIDKELLGDFPEEDVKDNKKKENDFTTEEEIQKEKQKIAENTRTIGGGSGELKKLFTANSLSQNEMIRSQIELISFNKNKSKSNNKEFYLDGIIIISKRVNTIHPQKPEEKKTFTKKPFKDL